MCLWVIMCTWGTGLAFQSIEVEIWSWVVALYAAESVEEWSWSIARLISFLDLFQSLFLFLEWMLSEPVRSTDVRNKSILACMGRLVVGTTGNTISTVEIEYSFGWIIGRRACNTLLLRRTVKRCSLRAKILRCSRSIVSNVGFCLSYWRICGDALLQFSIILVSILTTSTLASGWVIHFSWLTTHTLALSNIEIN